MPDYYHIAIEGKAIIAIEIDKQPVRLHITSVDGPRSKKSVVFRYANRGTGFAATVDVAAPENKEVGANPPPDYHSTTDNKTIKRRTVKIGDTKVKFVDPGPSSSSRGPASALAAASGEGTRMP